jgi:hypothetical protein
VESAVNKKRKRYEKGNMEGDYSGSDNNPDRY